jgi:lycopene beta-cyclase
MNEQCLPIMFRQTLYNRLGMGRGHDYALVGIGLANALVVLALARQRPGARLALIEQAEQPLGNHTWCFHVDDLTPAAAELVAPAVAVRWPRYVVRFPEHVRTLEHTYSAVTVPSLAAAFEEALGQLEVTRFYGRAAHAVSATRVELADGEVIEARLVIDARGPGGVPGSRPALGYQKFVGHELRVSGRTPEVPVMMDARVEQVDGFRFVYVLPLGPDRVLIEDTCYASDPALDLPRYERRIAGYAQQLGLTARAIVRREQGVLPLPGRVALAPIDAGSALSAGFRAGFFHPVTGYSLPLAARFALLVASCEPQEAHARTALWADSLKSQLRFGGFLNHLLFGAMRDDARRNVLERFYTLPEDTVRRFYALSLTPRDRARLVCGRPPRGFSLLNSLSKREVRPT